MEQRLSLITLGVADLERSRRFYEEGLGWKRSNADESIVFWNKGDTAFLTEGADDNITYKDCVAD